MNQFFTKVRKVFSVGILLVNLGVIAILLISVFGVNIRPYTTSFFAYLGMTFPLWALLNIGFIIYWSMKWNWRAFFSIAALLITIQSSWCYFPLNLNPNRPLLGETYKVLTYNVQNFCFSKKDAPDKPNDILQYIRQQDADVVCIQEYAASTKKGFLDSVGICQALKKYPYHVKILSKASDRQEGGVAVFSKYPIKNAREIEYNSKFNSSMICDVYFPEGVISFVNNHLESNQLTSEDRKMFSEFTDDISKEKAKTVFKELIPKLGAAFKKRAHQADVVRSAIDTISNRYIVCGDFNDTPGSYVYKKIKGNMSDAFARNGRGLGISYNQNRFYFRIDHLLYSEGLDFMSTYIEQVRFSDHYPVVGIFAFD